MRRKKVKKNYNPLYEAWLQSSSQREKYERETYASYKRGLKQEVITFRDNNKKDKQSWNWATEFLCNYLSNVR